MRSIKILLRNLDPSAGGGISSTRKLLEAYCTEYADDRLAIMCPGSSPLTEMARFRNVELQTISSRLPREIQRLTWGTYEVRRQLTREAYDLVWCMNVGPYVKTNTPQVLSLHNAYQVYPWKVARLHPGTRLRVAALRWFFRKSLRQADAVIAQTDLMKGYVREIAGCPRAFVLPKAVVSGSDDRSQHLSPSLRRVLKNETRTVTLLYVATYCPHKNHGLLVSLLALCRRQNIRTRLVVTLSPAEWKLAGGSTAESLVRSGHVLPVGWVAKDQLPELYAYCDVCVMPSLLESLSSAHLEAMQWGKPQIVADLPYAHDLCGEAALYADPTDPGAWLSQLDALRTGFQLRDSLVAAGTRRLNVFPKTWTDMAQRLRDIFVTILDKQACEMPAAHEQVKEAVNAL